MCNVNLYLNDFDVIFLNVSLIIKWIVRNGHWYAIDNWFVFFLNSSSIFFLIKCIPSILKIGEDFHVDSLKRKKKRVEIGESLIY